MNIYDVSERSGVSIATVSRVLNNSPHVSAKTRAKVLAVMEECGYVPNAFARGLGLNTMKTIGLLCSFNVDSYTTQAVYQLETALRERGYYCQLSFTSTDYAARVSTIEQMRNRHVDGIILIGSSFVENDKAKTSICVRRRSPRPSLASTGRWIMKTSTAFCAMITMLPKKQPCIC